MTIKEIEQKRLDSVVCRHCGGPVPCWSSFGDREVGKRHTRKSFKLVKSGAVGIGGAFVQSQK